MKMISSQFFNIQLWGSMPTPQISCRNKTADNSVGVRDAAQWKGTRSPRAGPWFHSSTLHKKEKFHVCGVQVYP